MKSLNPTHYFILKFDTFITHTRRITTHLRTKLKQIKKYNAQIQKRSHIKLTRKNQT